MFKLDAAILEWRAQMLAAGIGSPVPLEELESHLREEIDARISTGTNVAEAFAHSVERIGQPDGIRLLQQTSFRGLDVLLTGPPIFALGIVGPIALALELRRKALAAPALAKAA